MGLFFWEYLQNIWPNIWYMMVAPGIARPPGSPWDPLGRC